jgi:hypothetical protein
MRILVLLLLSSFAAGCSSPEAPTEPAPSVPRVTPEETPPKGALATISLGDPGSLLDGASALVESPLLRALVPQSTGELLRGAIGLPPEVVKRVPTNAPLAGLVLEAEDGRATVYAVRLDDIVDGVAPLGGGIETRPGGPSKGLWIRDASVDAQPEIALVGDLLFASESRDAIERAHRHLAHRLTLEGDGALRVTLETEAFARHVRPILERAARAVAEETLERVREARDEKGREPELGDPEALVEWMRDEALELASLLPDLADAHATLRIEGGLARLDLELAAKAGSPLESKLKKAPAVAAGSVRELVASTPEGAALALGLAEGEALSSALKALGRGRLSEGDGERLDGALGGEGPRALVLGGDRQGGYLRLTRAGSDDAGWATAALSIPHVRTLLAALASCDAPRKAPRFDKGGSATLCVTGDTRATLTATAHEGTSSLTLATTAKGTTRAAGLEAARASAHADAARAIGSLDDEVAIALYLEGSRVIPTLSLMAGFHELRALSSDLLPRPVVVSAGAKGREARLRVAFAPGSIDRFFALFGEARRILAGR